MSLTIKWSSFLNSNYDNIIKKCFFFMCVHVLTINLISIRWVYRFCFCFVFFFDIWPPTLILHRLEIFFNKKRNYHMIWNNHSSWKVFWSLCCQPWPYRLDRVKNRKHLMLQHDIEFLSIFKRRQNVSPSRLFSKSTLIAFER